MGSTPPSGSGPGTAGDGSGSGASLPARSGVRTAILLIGLVAVALNLRPALTTVGPVLPEITEGLSLTPTQAGALTSLPLLLFALTAPVAPRLGARFGMDRTVGVSLLLLTVALLIRPWGGFGLLAAGTVLAAGAIAVANVLMPGVVRRDFPVRAVAMTGVYSVMLSVGAAASAGATVPVADALGGWQWGLGVWGLLAAIGLVAWLTRGWGNRTGAAAELHWRRMLRSPLAWQVSMYLGSQSIGFYCMTTWMPAILRDAGTDATYAGLMLSVAIGVGAVAGLVIPQFAARHADQRIPAAGTALFTIAGLVGLALAPAAAPVVWAVLLGIGQGGTFPLAISLIVLRTRSAGEVPTLSAMAHAIGYTMSATGPIIMGSIFAATGAWGPAIAFVVVVAAGQVVLGLLAGRARYVD